MVEKISFSLVKQIHLYIIDVYILLIKKMGKNLIIKRKQDILYYKQQKNNTTLNISS